MPHMITVDQQGHVWLTDVGLHQVFKYDASGKLLLTLGKKLEPGTGSSFCKPTQVICRGACQRASLHPSYHIANFAVTKSFIVSVSV